MASASGVGGGTNREDERFRSIVLGEVLEQVPKTSFADIADLKAAKQALLEAVVLPRYAVPSQCHALAYVLGPGRVMCTTWGCLES